MERREFLKNLSCASTASWGVRPSRVGWGFGLDADSQEHTPLLDPVAFSRSLRIFTLEHGKFWDPKQVVEVLSESGANAIRCDVGIYRGLVTLYPSRYLPPHPELGNRNPLRDLIEECRPKMIHVFPYNAFYGYMSPEIRAIHPEWAMQNPNGSTEPIACQNNPHYVSTYARACGEIVAGYDVAGMYFDGPAEPDEVKQRLCDGRIENHFCFCKYCHEVFHDLFHGEMPTDASNQYDPEFRRRMLAVHMHGIHFFASEVSKEIKSVRSVPVLVNMCDPSIRTVRYPAMTPEGVDGGLVAEIHRGQPFGSHVAMNFMHALANTKVGTSWRKASWCYCPIGPHEQYVTYDNLETKIFGMMQLAHGGTPLMETLEAYLYDRTGLPAIKSVFATLEKNAGLFMKYTPVPFVALHCSEAAGVLATANDPKERLGQWGNDHFRGAFAALTHAHVQFDVVLDQHLDLDHLSQYKVLFLPDSTCLSEGQIDAVREFVRHGGGLISTHETSLYDEVGRKRKDFGLGDVFFAAYRGKQDLVPGPLGNGDPYIHIVRQHPVTEGIPLNKLIPCLKEPFIRAESLPGGDAVADIYVADTGEEFRPIVFTPNSPAAVIAGQYGKGRAVYISQNVGSLYEQRGFKLVRDLIRNSVEWVSASESPVRTDAPIGVIVNLTEKVNRRALHLINYTGNISENVNYKVEWVAPLADLRFSIKNPEGCRLSSAQLFSMSQPLPFKEQNGSATVRVPKLEIYDCVMLEYA